jgi:lysophospholipase L1-like esterase
LPLFDPFIRARHSSRHVRQAIVVALALVLVVVLAPVTILAQRAGAATSEFYLDLGASVSVGVQPSARLPHGQRTHDGYANELTTLEASNGVALRLHELGCPGESTTTMLTGNDHCYHGSATQMNAAVEFLAAHYDETGLVTIDLGFNDLMPCLRHEILKRACLSDHLARVKSQLARIVALLRAAAGPNVTFVGVGHYNPFLADWLYGSRGRRFATASVGAMGELNQTLASVYGSFSIPMADVAAAFRPVSNQPVNLAPFGQVPADVAITCAMTWMCQAPPYGPNIHPTDLGYRTIASAIAAVLPVTW